MHRVFLSLPVLAVAIAIAAPAIAAEDNCKHTEPRQLDLDIGDAKAVVFDVASHDLKLVARSGNHHGLRGRACASDAKLLPQLSVTQRREGDKLVVLLRREGRSQGIFFSKNYAYLELDGSVPDNMPVQLKVGSGDAEVRGAAIVSADVGSGDAVIRETRGLVAFDVGSGDVEVDGAGSLKGISIGSGDAQARHVRGPVSIGTIGSGDFDLEDGQGRVEIESIGSGDAELSRIGGDVVIGSVGSGNVGAREVRGGLSVRSVGSGSIDHSGVAGTVSLPRRH
ncbi:MULTISPECIES: hypothetical protein [unclassified Pseudoxanthomonas]|uniref:hypothetical protein n=1 Tax=unclassified Pseudoxanthomonas TaxID=2645906 RepID=UPI00160B748C|nr:MULTISPECIES: hypothetical protein [unclassified Pseudoxanthomonas]MBB3276972.1 DUF4097 and DUF4098 domain-containing protein YvlB [Pseudoxanthomonas sp. OG2]MBD9376716.1 hypothetical protein [Pseudoxanthomonas sp. PXM04]MBV7475736.1 hypothetical protein [Pseudoxanthomonas sp. PXM05]UBB26676.1 hypothetical protein LAG73_06245 [Pseudoxanthomonas japonensis]